MLHSVAPRRTAELPLSLLIVQATRFCNINCRYCYLPHRNRHELMPDETLDAIVRRLSEHRLTRDDVTVVWHAGEPLAAGIPFYRKAFARFATLSTARFHQNIQTNGTLITEEWCSFFKEHGVSLGVSLDGPKHIHDANRVTRAGKGTFDQIMSKIALLKKHNVKFSILSVVTLDTIPHIEELFRFYHEQGFHNVGLLLEETEGANKDSPVLKLDEITIKRFWSEVIRYATAYRIDVREVSEMVPRLLGQEFQNSQTIPGEIISIGHSGDFSTYSPELLEQPSNRYGSFVIGNVHNESFIEAFRGAKNEILRRDIDAGLAKCETGCDYFSVCKGGYPSNKHSETGSFDAAEHEYCQRYFKIRADAFLDNLEAAAPKP